MRQSVEISGSGTSVERLVLWQPTNGASAAEVSAALRARRASPSPLQGLKIKAIFFRLHAGTGSFDINLYAADNNVDFVNTAGSPADLTNDDALFKTESTGVTQSDVEGFVYGPIGVAHWQPTIQSSLVLAAEVTGTGDWTIKGYLDLE